MQSYIKLTGIIILSLIFSHGYSQKLVHTPTTVGNHNSFVYEVPDASFETTLAGYYKAPLSSITRVSDSAYSGKYALRIFIKEQPRFNKNICRGNVVLGIPQPVTGGQQVRIKFYMRHQKLKQVIPVIQFYKGSIPLKNKSIYTKTKSSNRWFSYIFDFKVPADADKMLVFIYGWGSNDGKSVMDIDDIRIGSPAMFPVELAKQSLKLSYRQPVILPEPKQAVWGKSNFNANKIKYIEYYPSPNGYEEKTAQKIQQYIFPNAKLVRGLGETLNPATVLVGNFKNNKFIKALAEEKSLLKTLKELRQRPQAYLLKTTDSSQLVVAGIDGAGTYYAFRTLLQLKYNDPELRSRFTITDWPDMPRRGIVFHIGSKPLYKKAIMKKFLFELAGGMKYNTLILGVEWGGGLTFQRPENKKFNPKKSSAYTREYMRWVLAYAKENFINVYPLFNPFSHATWLIKRYPELQLLKSPGNLKPRQVRQMSQIVNIYNPKFKSIIQPLLQETYEIFDKPTYFHIGFDEIWLYDYQNNKTVKISSDAQQYTRQQMVYDAIRQQNKMLKDIGVQKVIMWSDMLIPNFNGGERLGNTAEIAPQVAKLGIIPMHWVNEAHPQAGQEQFLLRDNFKTLFWSSNTINSYPFLPQPDKRIAACFSNLWGGPPFWSYFGIMRKTFPTKLIWQYGKLFQDANLFWNLTKPKYSYSEFINRYSVAMSLITSKNSITKMAKFEQVKLGLKHYNFKQYWQVPGYGFDFSMLKNMNKSPFKFNCVKNQALVANNSYKIVTININRKVSFIALLHSLNLSATQKQTYLKQLLKIRWRNPAPLGNIIGEYILHYTDGTSLAYKVRIGYDINRWNDQNKLLYNATVFQIPYLPQSVSAYAYTISNPYPNKTIKKLVFHKTEDAVEIAIFAVSTDAVKTLGILMR
ncbi:MAG: beta-N-acetylhexosaminidase [Victivallaceae bacterium]|nr:beta-N-acetylhexosaminidase [Victivallaceae bacterium]